MRFRVELSDESHKQLSRFPRDVRERIERAIDEFEGKDDLRARAAPMEQRKGPSGSRVEGAVSQKSRAVPDHFQEAPR
jgi:mRNA-degrading endonuclease RelE of RelBE toxin-antitoxin system